MVITTFKPAVKGKDLGVRVSIRPKSQSPEH